VRSGTLLAALLAACGATAPPVAHEATDEPDAGARCRPATYVCSVLAAWSGVSVRVSMQIHTGDAAITGEIVGDGFRCVLTLESIEPEHHLLCADCAAGDVSETFELHEPTRTSHASGGWTLEPACWYAQEGHALSTCDTCRPVDYCEGPDVGFD
jgi:hypothetical protein